MRNKNKYNMKVITIIISLLVMVFTTHAQGPPFFVDYIDCDSCLIEEDNQHNPMGIGCENSSSFFNANSFFMINPSSITKIVGVNFVFLQKDNASGNFQETDAEHQQIIDDIITIMNSKMNNLAVNACGGVNAQSKIQYQVNKLYIKDSFLWNNDNDRPKPKCPNRSTWYLRPKAVEIDTNPEIPVGIDIFFTNGANAYEYNVTQNNPDLIGAQYACSMFPDKWNLEEGSYVHMPDVFIKYHWMKNWATQQHNQPWLPVVYSWFVNSTAETIIHELGHSLGLNHDYTCVAHNIMNDHGNGCSHDYLTDNQLYIAHRNLSITNIRRFVREQSTLDEPLTNVSHKSKHL